MGTAAERICFGTRNNAMCTHQHLIPEPQTRTSKRISKACQRRTFYIEDLTRSSYKNLLWASKNLHASTYAEQFEDLNASTSWGGFNRISTRPSHKDLYEITQHPLRGFHQDLSRIFSRNCKRPWLRSSPRSSCQDPQENPTRSS